MTPNLTSPQPEKTTGRSTSPIRCDGCGVEEAAELVDAKDDGTGNFTVMQCIACYGPGYDMLSEAHASLSRQPHLRPLYEEHIAARRTREAAAARAQDETRAREMAEREDRATETLTVTLSDDGRSRRGAGGVLKIAFKGKDPQGQVVAGLFTAMAHLDEVERDSLRRRFVEGAVLSMRGYRTPETFAFIGLILA